MRLLLVALLLLLPAYVHAQGVRGTTQNPMKTIQRQAKRVEEKQHTCSTTTSTIFTADELHGCYSLLLRNSGTVDVVLCVDNAACTTATGGVYIKENESIVYDHELAALVEGTGIECDMASGTAVVYATLACAQ